MSSTFHYNMNRVERIMCQTHKRVDTPRRSSEKKLDIVTNDTATERPNICLTSSLAQGDKRRGTMCGNYAEQCSSL